MVNPLRVILLKPVLWAARKFASRPNRERVFEALSKLRETIYQEPGKRGLVLPFEEHRGKFIILSDQHKGARNGADDFMSAEPNYLAALDYYCKNDFIYINLGDSEELWKNNLYQVKKYNKATFEAEKKFLAKNNFVKIFGNHDLYWDNDPLAAFQLKAIYSEKLKVYEGIILPVSIGDKTLQIYCTHGHQGDSQSDGNWFSKFFVANIWAPLQAFLRINPNTPAYDAVKKTLHNVMMYEWSSKQENLLLITGHTHQPVFGSLTHLERLYQQYETASKNENALLMGELQTEIRKRDPGFPRPEIDYTGTKPSYFNSGCCCFSDGDITGIEIGDGCIRLIKWEIQEGHSQRSVVEEISLKELLKQL
jgi:UDP-2,3-diacylglucosamine pyrophosphatase LpxH